MFFVFLSFQLLLSRYQHFLVRSIYFLPSASPDSRAPFLPPRRRHQEDALLRRQRTRPRPPLPQPPPRPHRGRIWGRSHRRRLRWGSHWRGLRRLRRGLPVALVCRAARLSVPAATELADSGETRSVRKLLLRCISIPMFSFVLSFFCVSVPFTSACHFSCCYNFVPSVHSEVSLLLPLHFSVSLST